MTILAFPKKRRPTDAEFEELKRKRDEALQKVIDAAAREFACEPSDLKVHVSPSPDCYCACPDGPCQHIWNGDQVTIGDGAGFSVTCSRCGTLGYSHDLRCMS